MRVFSIARGFHYLWKHTPPELSPKEIGRLRAINLWQETQHVTLCVGYTG